MSKDRHGFPSLTLIIDSISEPCLESSQILLWVCFRNTSTSCSSLTVSLYLLAGGWWSGVPALSFDSQFLAKVEEKFPKEADLIVTCQKGLRSLAACELLYNAGYKNLFWIQGGLEAAEEEDLQRDGPQPFKFAGIGGVSEFLGWTDQQRSAAAKEGWGYQLVFSARLIGIFIVVDALYIGTQQIGHYLQDIRTH